MARAAVSFRAACRLLYLMMCKFPSDMASCSNVFLEFYVFPLVDDEQVEAGG